MRGGAVGCKQMARGSISSAARTTKAREGGGNRMT